MTFARHLIETAKVETVFQNVTVDADEYLVGKVKGQIVVFDATCPHIGGCVEPDGEGFWCPLHGWGFDREGQCFTSPNDRLTKIKHEIRDEIIWVK